MWQTVARKMAQTIRRQQQFHVDEMKYLTDRQRAKVLQEKIQSLTNELKKSLSKNENYEDNLKLNDKEIGRYKTLLEYKTAENEQLMHQLNQKNKELCDSKKEHNKILDDLRDQIEEEITHLKSMYDKQLKDKSEELAKAKLEHDLQKESFEIERANIKEELLKHEACYWEKLQVQKLLSECEHKNKTLQKEVESLRMVIATQLDTSLEELCTLKKKVQITNHCLDRRTQRLACTQNKLAEASKEIARKDEHIHKLDRRVQYLRDDNHRLLKKAREFEKDNIRRTQLKKINEDLSLKIEDLQNEKCLLTSQVQKLKSQIAELELNQLWFRQDLQACFIDYSDNKLFKSNVTKLKRTYVEKQDEMVTDKETLSELLRDPKIRNRRIAMLESQDKYEGIQKLKKKNVKNVPLHSHVSVKKPATPVQPSLPHSLMISGKKCVLHFRR